MHKALAAGAGFKKSAGAARKRLERALQTLLLIVVAQRNAGIARRKPQTGLCGALLPIKAFARPQAAQVRAFRA